MNLLQHPTAKRIFEATSTVFGPSVITAQVEQACHRFEAELENIQAGRGIPALVVAIVGAKGQGKTWTARQLVLNPSLRKKLPSGDLMGDATTKLVWIGPSAPDQIDFQAETFHQCASTEMIDVGQPLVLLDTPGTTDANSRAAQLAIESLSLAPVKLLVIARDQIRAAANLSIASQIDGSFCIPIITSVEPDEMDSTELAADLNDLFKRLKSLAASSKFTAEVLVPDFEISGDENAAGEVLRTGLLERLTQLGIDQGKLQSSTEHRIQSAIHRLQLQVTKIISQELPQLADAVHGLREETDQLPLRVINSLLGSQQVLETGIRMRLRAKLVHETSVLWFPYRTVISILNLTHGAWDRIVLALAGSIPSLFGALTSWVQNVRSSREFSSQFQEGIRQRTQQQVEERLYPLCDRFHRAVMRLRPRELQEQRTDDSLQRVKLLGIDQLQSRSQTIFEDCLERNAVSRWLIQLLGLLGVALFWILMAGPIVTLYRDYLQATWAVWQGNTEVHIDQFPHPTYGLFFTSLLLSLLPLLIYSMFVLTWTLGQRRIKRIASQVVQAHDQAIRDLQKSQVIRLQFGDHLLEQAQFLLNLNPRS